ncbi:MAG: PspC domain-containing protein [Propionibacteriales bacterium]|nr:PspC domain-containing protein [Propionibacteriales bacterium]
MGTQEEKSRVTDSTSVPLAETADASGAIMPEAPESTPASSSPAETSSPTEPTTGRGERSLAEIAGEGPGPLADENPRVQAVFQESSLAMPDAPAGHGAGHDLAPVDATTDESRTRRRAQRARDGAWLGGVCAGLAKHLGIPPLVIRLGFVALFCTQFVGALLYAVLWLVMAPEERRRTPGLEAHDRAGMRQTASTPRGADVAAVVALGVFGVGVVWLVQALGWGMLPEIFVPVTLASVGAAMVWRQADVGRGFDEANRSWFNRLVAGGGWTAVMRMVFGLLLVGAALTLLLLTQGNLAQLPQVLAMTALALAGLSVVLAPWIQRSRAALNEARAERARADARADVAAHLHDSVLQTLALIQRQSEDGRVVQQLARRQERELRRWLYGEEAAESTLKAALQSAAAEVEDEHAVPVELIVVGDHALTPGLWALVKAVREAMVNSAKHSGADVIDVYAEVDGDHVQTYIRDRGRGFSLDEIPEDRQGLRGSIMDRMERHNGRAVIKTSPDNGTEVRLEMDS